MRFETEYNVYNRVLTGMDEIQSLAAAAGVCTRYFMQLRVHSHLPSSLFFTHSSLPLAMGVSCPVHTTCHVRHPGHTFSHLH